ncbi:MAG: XdhC family protein [Lachnospiraceae bacterium]|nr:XdhC family protein [Lachnospiraceae bacterium]
MQTLFNTILSSMESGRDLVLVSLVKTEGSTPRGAGAHMLVGREGRILGTVGGGPLEGLALARCREVLVQRRSVLETMVLREDIPKGIGAVCGGTALMQLGYISHSDEEIKKAVSLAAELLGQHVQCRLIMQVGNAWRICIRGGEKSAGAAFSGEVWQQLSDKPVYAEEADLKLFIQPLLRDERVFVFGGGHVAQALIPVLVSAGFRCILVEDRPEFCASELFPGVEEVHLLPLDAWEDVLKVTDRDFLCIMTRGHEKDLDCLAQALRSPARYIGLMGSRRKIAHTNGLLRHKGFTDDDISRIVTPIGLDIGAETPAEIAISIAAQMISVRAGK